MSVIAFGIGRKRHLPHLEKPERSYFVTYVTRGRFVLPDHVRDIALSCWLHDHEQTLWLESVVVMPDHVHSVFEPYEPWTLSAIMKRVKGVSARLINAEIGRSGSLWLDESFDHMLRSDESLREKAEYICQNRFVPES